MSQSAQTLQHTWLNQEQIAYVTDKILLGKHIPQTNERPEDTGRFSFAPKKDGSPSYLQPLPENLKQLKPMTEHGYVAMTPTVNFRVKGADADSASQIRKLYQQGNDADRAQIITDLYGDPDSELKAIFDRKLGTEPAEIVTYGTPIIDGGTVDGGVRESREQRIKRLKESIESIRQQLNQHRTNINADYLDEKISR